MDKFDHWTRVVAACVGLLTFVFYGQYAEWREDRAIRYEIRGGNIVYDCYWVTNAVVRSVEWKTNWFPVVRYEMEWPTNKLQRSK